MANYAEYFELNGYKHKYEIGDRVFGHYKKVPFIGSVGNDRLVSPVTGPEVTIHLDLPLCLDGTIHRVIIVKHKDIKRLVSYDTEENSGVRRKTSRS
jgi:hypothetical protein